MYFNNVVYFRKKYSDQRLKNNTNCHFRVMKNMIYIYKLKVDNTSKHEHNLV